MGRPSKYDPVLYPQLTKWMRRSGLTEAQVAKELGVNIDTLYSWRKRYPEFTEALKEDKAYADSQVEDSLFKRALGYEYEETKIVATKGEGGPQRIEKTKKVIPPDVTAQIFWLKNRQKEMWRDQKELGVQGELTERHEHIEPEKAVERGKKFLRVVAGGNRG